MLDQPWAPAPLAEMQSEQVSPADPSTTETSDLAASIAEATANTGTLIQQRLTEAAQAIAAAQAAFNAAVGQAAIAVNQRIAARAAALAQAPQPAPLPPPAASLPSVDLAEQAVAAATEATGKATAFVEVALEEDFTIDENTLAAAQQAAQQSVEAAEQAVSAAMAASEPLSKDVAGA
jgi:hypothetical protein